VGEVDPTHRRRGLNDDRAFDIDWITLSTASTFHGPKILCRFSFVENSVRSGRQRGGAADRNRRPLCRR